MEYLYAVLVLISFWAFSTIISSFIGIFLYFIYAYLGLYFGLDYLIIGLGGLWGSIININSSNSYLNSNVALSSAPKHSKFASISYLIFFIFGVSIYFFHKKSNFSFTLINTALLISLTIALIYIIIEIKRLFFVKHTIEIFLMWLYLSFETLWFIHEQDFKPQYIKLLTASGIILIHEKKYKDVKITNNEIFNLAHFVVSKYVSSEYEVRWNSLMLFSLYLNNAINIRRQNQNYAIEPNSDLFENQLNKLNKTKILKNVNRTLNSKRPPKKCFFLANKFIVNHSNWYNFGMFKLVDN